MESVARLSRVAINHILLATDFSSESQLALQYALSLAKRHEAKLFITHAVRPDGGITTTEMQLPVPDLMQSNAERNVALLEQTEELKSFPHEVIVESGEAWEVLNKIACNKNIDLVVMGTHGRGGIDKLFLGSTAEKVIRHASCPVLTVGPEVNPLSLGRFGHILYATDFSDGSMRALTYALSLAEQDGAELTMLHVIESNPISEFELFEWKLDDRQKLNQLIPPEVDLTGKAEIEVEVGAPAEEIVCLAGTRNAELIVMGARCGGVLSTHLPWTTLHHVLRHAPCPVLTVRGEPFAANRAEAVQNTIVWFSE
jgi:nucleotide-binding universal stress UspA family protein